MQTLENVTDQSSLVIKVDFTDEVGDPVVPESASWTLTDGNEEVINERLNVEVILLDSTIHVPLNLNDLVAGTAIDAAKNNRIFMVTAEYVSALTGLTLTSRQAARFTIDNLPDPGGTPI